MGHKSESGQSLLVIVLLISVVFTLISTASYRLTTETQTTRLREESIKTLAAADSGVEKGVQYANTAAETPIDALTGNREVTFASLGLTLPGINPLQSMLSVTAELENTFISPLLTKDEQFTFYLHKYPKGAASLNQPVNVYFGTGTCTSNGPALEFTLIYNSDGTGVRRWLVDPCNTIGGASATKLVATTTAGDYLVDDGNIPTTFKYRVTVPITQPGISNAQILLVRLLNTTATSSRLGFTITSGQLYSQGQTIRSEAVSTNGVTKIVTLFKSYPQIPADFFVTRF